VPQLDPLCDQHGDIGILVLHTQQRQVDGQDLRVEAGEMHGELLESRDGIGRVDDGLQRRGEIEPVVDMCVQGQQQLRPGREVQVQRPSTHPGTRSDRPHGRLLGPLFLQQVPGSVEHRSPGAPTPTVLWFTDPIHEIPLDSNYTRCECNVMDEHRYRAAEDALWHDAGVTPTEHRIHLARNDVTVRVLEVGEGPATLFLHGGPGAAGPIWAYLAARLPQLRCLLVDRPGTGLSDPQPLDGPAAVRRECETLVADVLDGLGLERAHLVGSSHGSYIALLSAAAHPDRVVRTVHLGCPGFVEGMTTRVFDRLVLLPGAARVFSRLPAGERGLRSTLRLLGHATALEAGTIPQPFIDWSLALQRHTDTMRNELSSMANMGTFRHGFDPALTIDATGLEQVPSPTYLLWGDHDPYGDEPVARQLADALPDAKVEMLPGAGHLCWLDHIDHAADTVRNHLLSDVPARMT
jgi:2-hydroxy-6-oxonona-2,4-dienedioate hydrolase